jgi:predicted secreted Zn-dependent protease
MTAKKGTAGTSTYALNGKTLVDIDKDMQSKGPKDPNAGGREYGSCRGTLVLAISGNPRDFVFEPTPNSSPLEMTATLKTGTLTLNTAITMPKLASGKELSPDALKEWNRFVTRLQVHEDGHADSYYDPAVAIAKEIDAEPATGTGKDERTAQVAAQKALIAQISKDYGGSVLSDRVKADAAKYDSQTGSGAKQGAVLDTSIT